MNILKIILLGVISIVALLLIIALFVKKEYVIERKITIGKPDSVVFNYLKVVRNQDNYNTWVMMDPAMKKSFRGTDGTVGFVYAWDGNNKAGKGEQEITRIDDGRELDLEIRFIRPFEGVAHTKMITTSASANQTIVTWSMAGKSTYPMNLTNLFIDGMLGKDLERSLINLKSIMEK